MAISMEAVGWYIEINLGGADEEEIEDLQYFLQVLDDKYLEDQIKRIERSRNKASGKGKGRSRGR